MSEIRNLQPAAIWRNFDDLTQIPRPLRTGLDAGFTGYNNDCRIRCGYSLLHFSHEIKISRCI